MKKFLRGTASSLVFFSLVFLAGCPDAGVTVSDNTEALVNTFWAGETDRAGDWLTIAFLPDRMVAWTYVYENIWSRGEYTFDSANNGTIVFTHFPNPIEALVQHYPTGVTLAPSGFSVSGNTLTIANYRGQGASREFRKVRGANRDEEIPVPFTDLAPLAGNLAGSVWAGVTPAGASAWMTLSFRARGTSEDVDQFGDFFAGHYYVAVISYAHDSTTAVFRYTVPAHFNPDPSLNGRRLQGSPGSLAYTTNFSPTPGPGAAAGVVSGDPGRETIYFQNFHGGLIFRRYR